MHQSGSKMFRPYGARVIEYLIIMSFKIIIKVIFKILMAIGYILDMVENPSISKRLMETKPKV
jgi:hypothetical protein